MLYFGGDWLVEGASKLARSFGISALVVGLTVVAFGTSVPELLVSVSAALGGTSDIAIGNVIGSNIANIGLILGVAGLIFPIAVRAALLKREIPILVTTTAFTALLFYDGTISRLDGLLLVIGLVAFNVAMIYFARQDHRRSDDLAEEVAEYEAGEDPPITPAERIREVVRLGLGLVVLAVGAQLTVTGAVSIARDVGVSELVIGITLVAVGTSLPELATAVVAAFNKQSDIAIGNVVGSNIFNLLSILGITALIRPISMIQPMTFGEWSTIVANPLVYNYDTYFQVTRVDGPVMLGFTLLLFPFVLNRRIGRGESLLLLTLYVAFSVFVVVR
ncbi:MAG: calcium/sodium antiporter [Chloroflexota bacterium]